MKHKENDRKQCKTCEEYKLLNDFSKYQLSCKVCRATQRRVKYISDSISKDRNIFKGMSKGMSKNTEPIKNLCYHGLGGFLEVEGRFEINEFGQTCLILPSRV